jgi:hypothetical protein
MFFKLGVPGIEQSSASVLMHIRGHGHRQRCLQDRRRRGRSAVLAVEIHITYSVCVYPFWEGGRKEKNTRRGTIFEDPEGVRNVNCRGRRSWTGRVCIFYSRNYQRIKPFAKSIHNKAPPLTDLGRGER